jgi:hypothetical protein
MPNPYVVPSKDVQIYLTFEGLPAIKIGTGTSLNLQYSQTVQDIFAIGETDPIDLVQLNAQYAATLSHQTGEQHTILDAINGALPAGQTPSASLIHAPTAALHADENHVAAQQRDAKDRLGIPVRVQVRTVELGH